MRHKLLLVYSVAILLGITTGIVGSFFQIGIRWLDYLIEQLLVSISTKGGEAAIFCALISMILTFIAWLMVRSISPEASGSGVQEIEGALLHERPIFWRRLLPVKFIAGVMAISAKLVLGREGPTIQMGGNLGDMFGEMLHFSQDRRDTLIMAGAAAGLATAFNAPLAGVLFVLEELRNEFNFTFTNFKTVAISCVMATITLHFIIGPQAAISMSVFALPSLKSLWLFFILGIMVGFLGILFNQMLMLSLRIIDTLTLFMRVAYVLAIGAGVGFLAYYQPDLVGGGYRIIHQALTFTPSASLLVVILVIRFFTTMLCYSTGVPGGIFAPMLALGALFGTASSYLLQNLMEDITIHPGMFAVAGMGALFAAAVRAPITGIVLVVEMTQNYSLILPLMVSCLTSTTIMQLARNEPIYTQLLRRTLKRERELAR
ncbi:H(+)/Cl(-) exchange transporter ClcA [Legionella micdadei]|uniref:Chloride channel protein, CIC family n=1 Tax=Legionella micdadei TaxID=451 RepID=A0A098GFE3_LEGMI|nr:H(+)/Cl(-) exchange transporter ClcA [Legionella micdadei]ARG97320.1 ClC family H(+)/Cl(-) exchange transporter [Legionella micdadei]ARH00372.1 ClC family H(+)/Cl(-) exchange transporter [Legionella micdadei]KTD28204.1 voltage-gated chloride channel protein (ClC-type) [Legionella micdadei]NSL16833.1 H(+)/Cl(-) exchange transporter ClcA [Legionella micdadei]CEG61209.1 H(+)/Cl(-) exchange transporter ClcA [Legionella micdadei]